MAQALDWLDVVKSFDDGERVGLEAAASVGVAHQAQVLDDVQRLLVWLHANGGPSDESGEGLARWAVDQQCTVRANRFELQMTLDIDNDLFHELSTAWVLDC